VGRSWNQRQELQGEQDVAVNGADVGNVALELHPRATFPVQVLNAPDGVTPNVQIRLIRSIASEGQTEWWGNSLSPFANVPPGFYSVSAQVIGVGSQGGVCLDSLQSGGADVGRQGLAIVGGAAPPLQLLLRTDCASLDVKIIKPEEVRELFLLVVPGNPSLEPSEMGVTPDAPIHLGPLSPGTYSLYAFDNIDNLEYANPDAMRRFTAVEVTLDPGQSSSVTVQAAVRGADDAN
jgi:hypothetical protein